MDYYEDSSHSVKSSINSSMNTILNRRTYEELQWKVNDADLEEIYIEWVNCSKENDEVWYNEYSRLIEIDEFKNSMVNLYLTKLKRLSNKRHSEKQYKFYMDLCRNNDIRPSILNNNKEINIEINRLKSGLVKSTERIGNSLPETTVKEFPLELRICYLIKPWTSEVEINNTDDWASKIGWINHFKLSDYQYGTVDVNPNYLIRKAKEEFQSKYKLLT